MHLGDVDTAVLMNRILYFIRNKLDVKDSIIYYLDVLKGIIQSAHTWPFGLTPNNACNLEFAGILH